MPFSFLDDAKRPVGYSIDLCLAIVEDVADELGAEELRVTYRPVTPENRFNLVQAGEVDLECGSSTANVERRKLVAFSPTIFVTGTKLLVPRDSSIRTLRRPQRQNRGSDAWHHQCGRGPVVVGKAAPRRKFRRRQRS